MIGVPLDEAYLQWLYSQVGSVTLKHNAHTYWTIFKQLYEKEFVWFIPNDDNRVEDGRNLRHEFVEELRLTHVDRNWMELGCSFLEMLIALSRRASFEDGAGPREWFWHFMHVLDFDIYADNIAIPTEQVNDTLDRVIWRTYRRDGHGGLFPLRHPKEDQREVEIWYQLSAYLVEHDE